MKGDIERRSLVKLEQCCENVKKLKCNLLKSKTKCENITERSQNDVNTKLSEAV